MPNFWSNKEERQYRHILDSGASKEVAAATVNKYHGKEKKARGKMRRQRFKR